MLINELTACIKDIKHVYNVETDAKNQKLREDKISDFKNQVERVRSLLHKIQVAHSLFKFTIPVEIVSSISSLLTELDQMADDDDMELDQLNSAKKNIDKADRDLGKCWADFYVPKMLEKTGQIGVVINISNDQNRIQKIKEHITAAADWNALLVEHGNKVTIQLAKESMDQADAILKELDLRDDVKSFLQRVSGGSATLGDLTPEIADWINNKNLQSKFKFSFL